MYIYTEKAGWTDKGSLTVYGAVTEKGDCGRGVTSRLPAMASVTEFTQTEAGGVSVRGNVEAGAEQTMNKIRTYSWNCSRSKHAQRLHRERV